MNLEKGKTTIAVATELSLNLEIVKDLAAELSLPVVDIDSADYAYLLVITEQRLELRETRVKNSKPICVDFLHGAAAHRRKYGGGKKQLIAKAVVPKKGRPQGSPLHVLDATVGLGQDAFVLACLGCKLTLIERSPIIAALLKDGLSRAKDSGNFTNLSMNLLITDAIEYMNNLKDDEKPDVVYLDPMFPTRTKSALVKKEMRILRDLVGEDLDAVKLLETALQIAKKRVVVKRPRLAEKISKLEPDLMFNGKSSRFDVYIVY